ncbi:hypothetical protein, partial [Microcystis aeruginosa]|uniref:hypothetical protein n=1 Tax=Microcystis aeruginosa TaxID=1126 RepID=UPI001C89543C
VSRSAYSLLIHSLIQQRRVKNLKTHLLTLLLFYQLRPSEEFFTACRPWRIKTRITLTGGQAS